MTPDQQKALALKFFLNPVRLLIPLSLMWFLPLTGFVAIGTFIYAQIEGDFFARAVKTEGTVIEKTVESYRANTTTHDGRTTSETRYYDVLSIQYTALDGKTWTGKRKDGSQSAHAPGDKILLYYDPDNPYEIRFAKDTKTVGLLQTVSMVSACAFGGLLLLVLFVYKRGQTREKTVN